MKWFEIMILNQMHWFLILISNHFIISDLWFWSEIIFLMILLFYMMSKSKSFEVIQNIYFLIKTSLLVLFSASDKRDNVTQLFLNSVIRLNSAAGAWIPAGSTSRNSSHGCSVWRLCKHDKTYLLNSNIKHSLTCLSTTSSPPVTSAELAEMTVEFCTDVTAWMWMLPFTVMSFGRRRSVLVSTEAAAVVAVAAGFLSQDLSTIVECWLKRLISDALAGFEPDFEKSSTLSLLR